jgi:hypothetical protein
MRTRYDSVTAFISVFTKKYLTLYLFLAVAGGGANVAVSR